MPSFSYTFLCYSKLYMSEFINTIKEPITLTITEIDPALAGELITIESLEKACDVYGSYATIKKMISDGIQPNITCLRNACKIRNNITVIKLLIESGAQPDLECIANIAGLVHPNYLRVFLQYYFFRSLS